MLELRPFQREAIALLARNRHLLCVAPTGSGKSLVYERTAAAPGTRTLLVTPLVALARQQAGRLTAAGVPSRLGAGPGASGPPEPDRLGRAAWVISPEKLFHPSKERALSVLSAWRPGFLAVDECHCLWDWGADFRPAFLEVPGLIARFGIRRSAWLTATLPLDARRDLLSRLPAPVAEVGAFELPRSLRISVTNVPLGARPDALLSWIARRDGAGLVFTATRQGTLRLARLLSAAGEKAAAYHAGLSAEERLLLEGQVAAEKVRIVVATSAFGLGMDFRHLRWVVLWQAPLSLLSLAQAVGRVARGGESGEAVVLWEPADFRLLEWSAARNEQRRRELRATYDYLRSNTCRRKGLAAYFGVTLAASSCGNCDFCD